VLNIALPLRSFAEHAPFWDAWQLARDQTVRAGIDAESVLFGTFSAENPSRIVAHLDGRQGPSLAGREQALAEAWGKDDHPVVRNAPEGAFCPKERHSRPRRPKHAHPEMVWTRGRACSSDVTGPSRHWMSNVAYTKGNAAPVGTGSGVWCGRATWRCDTSVPRRRSSRSRFSRRPCRGG